MRRLGDRGLKELAQKLLFHEVSMDNIDVNAFAACRTQVHKLLSLNSPFCKASPPWPEIGIEVRPRSQHQPLRRQPVPALKWSVAQDASGSSCDCPCNVQRPLTHQLTRSKPNALIRGPQYFAPDQLLAFHNR